MSDAGSPWLLVLEHRVQNREELSHASGEGNLLRFPSREQVRVEASQYLAVPDADQRAHVQDGADLGPPSPDGAVSTQRSTVAIQRRDTDERSDLLAVQLAELGQFREKSCRDYAAYAGYAAQQVVFLAPDRAFANRCGQVIVDLLEPLPKPLHVLADTTAEIRRRRALPVLLRDEHLDELPAPRDESGESLSLLVGQHPGFRVHGLCEMRQHRRVERISLGEPSRGLGKVAHLPGIDDCDWHMCKRQRSSNGDLESARCFDDDQFDSVLGQALE